MSYLNLFIFNPMMMGILGMGVGMPEMGAGMLGVSAGMPAARPGSLHKEHSSSSINIPGDIHAFCEAYGIKEVLQWSGQAHISHDAIFAVLCPLFHQIYRLCHDHSL
jgi:hypothetical protein